MDKVFVSEEAYNKLVKWLEKHKETRLNVDEIPLNSFKLIEKKCATKFIKQGTNVLFSMSFNGQPFLKGEALLTFPLDEGKKVLRVPLVHNLEPAPHIDLSKMEKIKELAQGIMAQYVAVLTFMAHGNDDRKTEYEVVEQSQSSVHQSRSGRKRKYKGVTYVFQKRQYVGGKGGHHASPDHKFSVRGHYRHYRSGKVIWVAQFIKGAGKHRDKNYKLNAC